ncbi:DUF6545 domain-containing protein [Streptomyces sp. NBC_01601]|uniref:DUF6545 domain-containing protein n=1 Tax=Streptomyces sp. NBC_01601 TaxID=2975892 RepID=UPI002E2A1CAA|nr:DUF6545 domain-containing protein [Streptomyces sp. NBC_01601]
MAGIFFAIACWKGLALLREPTLTLALMTINFFIGGAVYVLASPAGYQWVGTASGQPWGATLPIYVGILVCYGKMHLLTILWTPPRPDEPKSALRMVTAWALAYCTSIVIMIVTFLDTHLDGPADPLRFNTEQADNPRILAFLAVFLVMLTSGTLNTWRRSRRAKVSDVWIAHALRWFGRSMVVTFGYVVCSVPAILAAAMGHHQLDNVGVMGASFGMLGCIGTCYGLSGAAASAWLRERRDIRLLQPLWCLVIVEVNAGLAFNSTRPRPNPFINIRWILHRRILEILDGIRELRQCITDEPALVLQELHRQSLGTAAARARFALPTGGLSPQELEAAVTAAVLRHAVPKLKEQRAQQNSTAGSSAGHGRPAFTVPGRNTAAAQERTRLVCVARALNHPLVEATLQIIETSHTTNPTRSEAVSAR